MLELAPPILVGEAARGGVVELVALLALREGDGSVVEAAVRVVVKAGVVRVRLVVVAAAAVLVHVLCFAKEPV